MSRCFTELPRLLSELMMKFEYENTKEFGRDIKRLSKKFLSLPDDLEIAKQYAIELYHLNNINKQAIFPIPNFCSPEVKICKLKKFACKSLKGRGVKSGIRVIYAFYEKSKKVVFLEMYFKGESENENKERIKEYLADT